MTREERLAAVAARGHVPHAFQGGSLTFFGLPACAACGRSALYVAHDEDLRCSTQPSRFSPGPSAGSCVAKSSGENSTSEPDRRCTGGGDDEQ